MFTLHPFQEAGVAHAIQALQRQRTDPNARPVLYSAPTGTGKSVWLNEVLRRLREPGRSPYVLAPSDEILKPIARKYSEELARGALPKARLEKHGYFTPIRLRNLLLGGIIPPPTELIKDEAHHDGCDTYDIIDDLVGHCPTVGCTATPFRGSAKETQALRAKWGDPVPLITMPEAVSAGYMAFPDVKIVPLLDDDVIDVVNGEFVVTQLNEQVGDVVDRVAEIVRNQCSYNPATGTHSPKRPTMLALPSVYAAKLYTASLRGVGIETDIIIGGTPVRQRDCIFERVKKSKSVLVQVAVVGEGVDLPIRCLIDLTPCFSPVKWLQLFGRATRPTGPKEPPPLYVGTNRNLLRHSYLLQGLLPPSVYKLAEEKFEGPSKRRNVRVIGLESLGKFTSIDVPLHNGTTGQLIVVQKLEGRVTYSYAAIMSPLHENIVYARRQNVKASSTGDTTYGRWERIDSIPELEGGFASVHKGEISEAQKAWWKRSARWYGLDVTAEPNNRTFQSLPILKDTGLRFR